LELDLSEESKVEDKSDSEEEKAPVHLNN